MINLKNQKPKLGQWIVWTAIEDRGGHQQSGIAKYTKDLEEQFMADDLSVFWYCAEAPARAMLKASLVSINAELSELPKRQEEIEERRSQVTDELEVVENELDADDGTPESIRGNLSLQQAWCEHMVMTQYEDDLMAQMEEEKRREREEAISTALEEYNNMEKDIWLTGRDVEREELELAARLEEAAQMIRSRYE